MLELTIILACFALILFPSSAAGDEGFESSFDIKAIVKRFNEKLSVKQS